MKAERRDPIPKRKKIPAHKTLLLLSSLFYFILERKGGLIFQPGYRESPISHDRQFIYPVPLGRCRGLHFPPPFALAAWMLLECLGMMGRVVQEVQRTLPGKRPGNRRRLRLLAKAPSAKPLGLWPDWCLLPFCQRNWKTGLAGHWGMWGGLTGWWWSVGGGKEG